MTVHSPLFSRIFIRWLNARRESRETWTPAQKGRLDWVGGGDPTSAFSFASVNREAVNILPLHQRNLTMAFSKVLRIEGFPFTLHRRNLKTR